MVLCLDRAEHSEVGDEHGFDDDQVGDNEQAGDDEGEEGDQHFIGVRSSWLLFFSFPRFFSLLQNSLQTSRMVMGMPSDGVRKCSGSVMNQDDGEGPGGDDALLIRLRFVTAFKTKANLPTKFVMAFDPHPAPQLLKRYTS